MADDTSESGNFGSFPEMYELIFEHSHEGMLLVEKDESGGFRYIEANPALGSMVGIEPEAFVGQSPFDLFEEDVARNFAELYQHVLDSGEVEEVTHENPTPRGPIVTQSRLQPLQTSEGRPRILVIARDITRLARTQEKLDRDREAMRDLYDVAGASQLDREQKLRRLLQIGCRRLELPFGFVTEIGDGVQRIRRAVGGHQSITTGEIAPLEHSYCRKTLASGEGLVAYENTLREGFEGDPAYERSGLVCYIGARLVARDELVGTICFASREPRDQPFEAADRTFVHLLSQWTSRELEREQLLEELTERARTDGLTGLLNHKTFLERFESELERADRYGGELSLLLLDLDHFKKVNDTFGHATGDEVLRQVATILDNESRSVDTVGRYGGEELAMGLPNTGLSEAITAARRILTRLRSGAFGGDDADIRLTGSIGVTAWTDETDVGTLVNQVDEALYEAKRRGRDQVVAATSAGFRPADGSVQSSGRT